MGMSAGASGSRRQYILWLVRPVAVCGNAKRRRLHSHYSLIMRGPLGSVIFAEFIVVFLEVREAVIYVLADFVR